MPKISRTTNPTSLKGLDAKLFTIRTQINSSGKRSFWLEKFDFPSAGLGPGLRLACIAHAGSTEEYFELGVVESPNHEAFPINELATDRPLKFRFVVFEEGNPRLIAFADNIRSVDEGGTLGESLVDIEPCELGGAAWRLVVPEIVSGADKPSLLVEQKLFPTVMAAAKDPWIAVFVMPEVMRQIARVIAHNIESLDDAEIWVSAWKEYLDNLAVSKLLEDADDADRDGWVDEVVSSFCAKQSMKTHFDFVLADLIGER